MDVGLIATIIGTTVAVAGFLYVVGKGVVVYFGDIRATKQKVETLEKVTEGLPVDRERLRLLWDFGAVNALGKLHHSIQPYFDDLLERFPAGLLTLQELDQFIARLREIESGAADLPEQVMAARVLLHQALEMQRVRVQDTAAITEHAAAQKASQDNAAAAAMAAESKRQSPESRPDPQAEPEEQPPPLNVVITGSDIDVPVKVVPEPPPAAEEETKPSDE